MKRLIVDMSSVVETLPVRRRDTENGVKVQLGARYW